LNCFEIDAYWNLFLLHSRTFLKKTLILTVITVPYFAKTTKLHYYACIVYPHLLLLISFYLLNQTLSPSNAEEQWNTVS